MGRRIWSTGGRQRAGLTICARPRFAFVEIFQLLVFWVIELSVGLRAALVPLLVLLRLASAGCALWMRGWMLLRLPLATKTLRLWCWGGRRRGRVVAVRGLNNLSMVVTR